MAVVKPCRLKARRQTRTWGEALPLEARLGAGIPKIDPAAAPRNSVYIYIYIYILSLLWSFVLYDLFKTQESHSDLISDPISRNPKFTYFGNPKFKIYLFRKPENRNLRNI
jgi:hypothetical protein